MAAAEHQDPVSVLTAGAADDESASTTATGLQRIVKKPMITNALPGDHEGGLTAGMDDRIAEPIDLREPQKKRLYCLSSKHPG